MIVTPATLSALKRIHADLGAAIAELSEPDPHIDELRLSAIAHRIVAQDDLIFLEGE